MSEIPPADVPKAIDRVVVGKWFDGNRHLDVEEVTWLSPWTLRRLGWDWEESRQSFDGQLVFVVRLAALERQDPLELGGDTSPGESVSRAGFAVDVLDGRGKARAVRFEVIRRWWQHARDPKELLRVSPLEFMMGPRPTNLPRDLGKNEAAVYEVRVPIDGSIESATAFRVRITTTRRTREAVFRRWPRISSP